MLHSVLPITVPTQQTGPAGLHAYVIDNSPEIDESRARPAVLLCPGGGYTFTSDREAEPIALRLLAMGYQCFILRYSVAPNTFPTSLLEVFSAIELIRQNSREWHVNPQQVYVMGFSAGGHLAACAGTLWENAALQADYGFAPQAVRPNGMVLCYPVITSGEKAHRGSFEALAKNDPALLELLSIENQVTPNTPPAFLWHTFDDGAVPVENSLLMAQALRRADVPFSLHIYPHGVHGLGLACGETAMHGDPAHTQPDCQSWIPLLNDWVESLR